MQSCRKRKAYARDDAGALGGRAEEDADVHHIGHDSSVQVGRGGLDESDKQAGAAQREQHLGTSAADGHKAEHRNRDQRDPHKKERAN